MHFVYVRFRLSPGWQQGSSDARIPRSSAFTGLFQGDSFALHITSKTGVSTTFVPLEPQKSCTAIVRNARAALRADGPKFQNPTRAGDFCTLALHHTHLFRPQTS